MATDRVVSGDDPAACWLCLPPHETSFAMLPIHLRDAHGIDPDSIAAAEVIDASDPRETGD